MTNIPDKPVMGGIESVMDGNRQLDHAKPGTQMTAGN